MIYYIKYQTQVTKPELSGYNEFLEIHTKYTWQKIFILMHTLIAQLFLLEKVLYYIMLIG